MVMLRNVNLRSRSLLWNRASLEDIDEGRSFLAMEDGEDSAAGPLQCTYLTESSAETSAEHS